jgi:hypothetical protein
VVKLPLWSTTSFPLVTLVVMNRIRLSSPRTVTVCLPPTRTVTMFAPASSTLRKLRTWRDCVAAMPEPRRPVELDEQQCHRHGDGGRAERGCHEPEEVRRMRASARVDG